MTDIKILEEIIKQEGECIGIKCEECPFNDFYLGRMIEHKEPQLNIYINAIKILRKLKLEKILKNDK
jgi:hypothetical protein